MGTPTGWRWPAHQPANMRIAVVTRPVELRSVSSDIDFARKSDASLDICTTIK
jgi:hypothetical protein